MVFISSLVRMSMESTHCFNVSTVVTGVLILMMALGGVGIVTTEAAHATGENGNITVQGEVIQPDGAPAANELILVFGGGTFRDPQTGENGGFMIEVPAETRQTLAFEQTSLENHDGTPDLYAISSVESASSVDLGEIQLPTAHILNVTVVDSTDNPVENATVSIEHRREGATASRRDQVNEQGQFEVGSKVGYEVVGDVSIEVREGTEVVSQRDLTVTEDRSVTVTVNEEPEAGSGLVDEYDNNGDGDITARELGGAVTDFGQGELTARELGEVVTAFGQS